MAVSQRFIDLLNVPLEQLRAAGEAEDIINAKSMTKWPLAERLAGLPRDRLEELGGGYLYAGRTSLSFFRFDEKTGASIEQPDHDDVPEDPALEGVPLDGTSVVNILNELSPSNNAFREANQPDDVTRDPQLVVAHHRDDGAMLLSFAVQRTVAQVIRNFESVPVHADDFFNVVLYPSTGLVEVRTSQQLAQRFSQGWLKDFAERFDLTTYPVSITPDDFTALKAQLAAGLTRWRGKPGDGGSMDTIEVKVAPTYTDLEGEVDFENTRAGSEQVMGYLKFNFDAKDYTIRIAKQLGSIYFITPAREAVIDHVRDALRTIKVRHRIAAV